LAALAGGGTVTFSCSGTITLTTTITITTDTTIDGSGQTVTISGNNMVQVFSVNPGAKLNLNYLTVANGRAVCPTGGGISNNGTLTVSNSTFSSNSGGIGNNGTLTVSSSTFSGNGRGGGILSFGGTVTVNNSTFSGNDAYLSGDAGIMCLSLDAGGIMNLDGALTVSYV
jgi:hypothetical protein